ncbi:MAG: AsmA-like C-terminal region-containing protein [Planctomycetaceae bacterium]
MKLPATIKWLLFIAVTVSTVTVAAGAWLLGRWEDLLRDSVLAAFDKAAPGLVLYLDQIQLSGTATLVLSGVEIRDGAAGQSLLRVGRLQLQVDESELLERRRLLLRSVEAEDVDVLLQRYSDGRWNWQDYEFRKLTSDALVPPVVRVRDVRARVLLQHEKELPAAELQAAVPEFQAVPASGSAYDFLGAASLPGAGLLALRGGCDLLDRSWSLAGSVRDVRLDQNLLELAVTTFPQLAAEQQRLDVLLTQMLPGQADATSGSAERGAGALVLGTGRAAPRLTGQLSLDFSASRESGAEVPNLRLQASLSEGSMSTAALPWQLREISAKLILDNGQATVQLLQARDGEMRAAGELQLPLGSEASPATGRLRLENFPVTMQLKPLLPPKTQRFFDHFQPGGTITGEVQVRRFPGGRWLPVSLEGNTQNGAMQFHRFRRLITGINARISQRPLADNATSLRDVIFDVEADGAAGEDVVRAKGWLRQPGAEMEVRFDVEAPNLPLDARFRDALDDAGRRVIESLNLSGRAKVSLACYRAPGPDLPTDLLLRAQVTDSQIRFRGFPYQVENVSGSVEFDSKQKSWVFTDVRGRHGAGQLVCSGQFRGLPAPGVLDLNITAAGAKLDADLFNALPESSRKLWTIINPEGTVNLRSAISWTAVPGNRPTVRLEDVQVYDAVICPRPFPYRMRIQSARLSYDPNDPRAAGNQHCEIHSLQADHEGSEITAAGWAEAGPEGDWQLHLSTVNARELRPDDQLRAALPAGWRQTLSRLAQTGRVSVEDSEIDFRGTIDPTLPVTAAWDLNLRLDDCEISAGLDLKHINGRVHARGVWDGVSLENSGELSLSQAEVLDMAITGIEGPWRMTDNELVLGNREVILGRVQPGNVANDSRVRGEAFGGSLEMDGIVNLAAGSVYRFFGELKNASLEKYARLHAPGQASMRGLVNSWMFVSGDGNTARTMKGEGQLQINPASLYEIPVVLELLSAMSRLNFTVSNRTAFDYALMSFKIRDEAFQFDPIDLVGDSISLRGRGRVGFGGDVVLDFYSRPPRGTGLRNPLSDILVSSATQWVTVQVRGTTSRPQTSVSTRPQIDESMRQFLNSFEPRPGAPLPALELPGMPRMTPGPAAGRPRP